jgi:outer membrane immunogenic protein
MNGSKIRKRTSGWFTAVTSVLLLLATSAMAQEGRSQINLQGTGVIIKDSSNRGIAQEATRSGGFLAGYSYQFHRWAGIEGNYGYTRNTQKFTDALGETGIQSDIHQITGAFVLHVPVETPIVKPYALAGAGALVFNPTDNAGIAAADRQSRAAFQYGGGLNFDVARNFGIRAEYRGFVYKTPDFKIGTLNLDTFTHLAQPSVGIFFRF